jgi:hypothetical protein
MPITARIIASAGGSVGSVDAEQRAHTAAGGVRTVNATTRQVLLIADFIDCQSSGHSVYPANGPYKYIATTCCAAMTS